MRRRGRQAGGWAPAAALALVLLPACSEPKPDYPPLEQPIAGVVRAEMSIVASGGAQQIDMAADEVTSRARLHVSIPAGAYPAGTKVTARLVDELAMPVTSCFILSQLLSSWASNEDLTLQISPDAKAPAVPLRVELDLPVDRWTYQVLHAKPGNATWTTAETFVPSSNRLSFKVPEPGLWTVVQLHFPPALQGRLLRTEVTCSNGAIVANDPPVIVEISGDSFTWARSSPGTACYKVSSGRLVWECASDWQSQRFTFKSSLDGYIHIDRHELDDAGTGIWWQRSGSSSECSDRAIERDHFVWQGGNPTPIPTMNDAGTCLADTAKDGGRD